MPKLESSVGSGQDSFFTIRISKRTALEISVAILVLGVFLWRQYQNRSYPASSEQLASASVLAAQATPASVAAPESPKRQSALREQSQTFAFTPEFGAYDPSTSASPDNDRQEPADTNLSSAPATPNDVVYIERKVYVPSDAEPSFPAPGPAEPEGNAPERSRGGDGSNKSPEDTRSSPTPDPAREPTRLNGAGATFPNPIYQKWFSVFHELHPQIEINYQSIGSGGGIKQLQSGTVDFAATDVPMTNEQIAQIPFRVAQIPTVLGAVVITYNVPGVNTGLRLSPDVLAGIFLGKIRNWNDPRILRNNPGLQLPNAEIAVVHRSDACAATFIFTDYLSKISSEWLDTVRSGAAVNWPVGLGGKGDEGVAGTIKQVEGSIGYVGMIHALANNLPIGSVQNSSGQFIAPSVDSIEAAADSIRNAADDFRVSITNPPGKAAYPIASFTWILLPEEWRDASKKRTLVAFLNWVMDRGEEMAPGLGYVPLPKGISARVRQKIRSM